MEKTGEKRGLGDKEESKNSSGHDTFEISLANSNEDVKLVVGYIREEDKFGAWENINGIIIWELGDDHLRRKKR